MLPHLIWLIVGIKPRCNASTMSGRHPPSRDVPESVSALLGNSLYQAVVLGYCHGCGGACVGEGGRIVRI